MNYQKMPEHIEQIATQIVHCAYKVHTTLGPGLLENVYECCFCHELRKSNLRFSKQVKVPVVYDGLRFEEALRLDVLVEDEIICELKAVEALLPLHQAQLLSYLKLSRKRLGFLINFHVPYIRDGIRRIIS